MVRKNSCTIFKHCSNEVCVPYKWQLWLLCIKRLERQYCVVLHFCVLVAISQINFGGEAFL